MHTAHARQRTTPRILHRSGCCHIRSFLLPADRIRSVVHPEFLEHNQNVIQLVGSAVLIGFGIYLFKKNPASSLKPAVRPEPVSPKKNILGGFLFTFSNPLILFLIIGLFARFNFPVPEVKFYHYIIGFLAIFTGAVAWWWMVTFAIDKVRAHFNLRSMWLINRIIGTIILLFAIVGIVTGITNLIS